jgi:hypothetical protein
MIAAAHYDNLLVLLFFGIAIFFQILTKAASKGRKRPTDERRRSTSAPEASRPLSREEDGTDQDQIRKFLEALGQPTTSTPPPPVASRPTYQRPMVAPREESKPAKRRSVLSPLPPVTTRPPESEPDWRSPREGVPVSPPPPQPVPVIATAASQAYEIATQPVSKSDTAKIDIATMLRSTSGLRDAIILREIFGPPRSMQPLDLVGSV